MLFFNENASKIVIQSKVLWKKLLKIVRYLNNVSINSNNRKFIIF